MIKKLSFTRPPKVVFRVKSQLYKTSTLSAIQTGLRSKYKIKVRMDQNLLQARAVKKKPRQLLKLNMNMLKICISSTAKNKKQRNKRTAGSLGWITIPQSQGSRVRAKVKSHAYNSSRIR